MTAKRVNKGNLAEKWVKAIFEDRGYQVQRAVRTQFQRNDVFGCWDIVAIKQDMQCFIQVSTKPWTHRDLDYRAKLTAFEFPFGVSEYWQVVDHTDTWKHPETFEAVVTRIKEGALNVYLSPRTVSGSAVPAKPTGNDPGGGALLPSPG